MGKGVIKPAAKRCIGNTYGKLKVVDVSWEKGKGTTLGNYVKCLCNCGNVKIIRADSLERGDSTSCGCNYSIPRGVKFSVTKTTDHPMYGVFCAMQQRCKNKNVEDYVYYGGRGITLCNRWNTSLTKEAFDNFLKDMEYSYEKGLEIERVDVNGNYEKSNCSWVCRKSQVNNIRRNRVLKGYGIELSVSEWGALLNLHPKLLDDRINHLKWKGDLEDLLSVSPRDRRHTLIYNGEVCTATQVWEKEGYTLGQRNARLNTYGDSIAAFEAEGIIVSVVKEREKDYLSFEDALQQLRDKERDNFEDWLLIKINTQLKKEG